MITLTVDNSVCSVSGLSAPQFKQLRLLLSYHIGSQAAYFSSSYNNTRYLLDKRGGFPTGLLYLVQAYLSKNKIRHTTNDRRKRPVGRQGLFTLSLGVPPYPEQIEAAKACLAHSRGIVSMPTGSGKSLVVALIINEIQVPTLVVVPTLELKRQLTQSLKAAFGAQVVGSLGRGGKSEYLITVENVDALDPKVPATGFDCVIIDEFHHSGAATYRKLNKKAWAGVYYKFGLTATPFRSREEERLLLESVLSKVIYSLDYHTAVKRGYIVPVEAYYIELPKVEPQGNEMSWPAMYSELIVNNEHRNSTIAGLLTAFHQEGISALCLVKEIQHGVNIKKHLEIDCPFSKGENDNNRELLLEFNLRERHSLIGTTGVLGEGVDTKPAEYVIIAGLGKSKNQFMQQVGRGVRVFPGKESCKVILFKDNSHKWSRAHFAAQCKFLREEYGCVPAKIVIA